MNIAICDNNKLFQKSLICLIKQYFHQKELPLSPHIQCYTDASQLDTVSPDWDILFTDIPAPSEVDVVKNLRSLHDFPVVFITDCCDYAVDAFEVNAVHYLVKPVSYDAIAESLERCLTSLKLQNEPILEIKTLHRIVPVSVNKIVYIEVFNNLSVIHTATSHLETYTPLKALFEMLDEGQFMKPHRSYIVNMKHIRHFYFDRLILDTGLEIVLSRKNRSDLKQQHQAFLFQQTQENSVS
jgi:DNA-binding LytR/AlgR family response regulator